MTVSELIASSARRLEDAGFTAPGQVAIALDVAASQFFDGHCYALRLDGRRLDVQIRARVLPGHEGCWDRVLVSLEDVTERTRA